MSHPQEPQGPGLPPQPPVGPPQGGPAQPPHGPPPHYGPPGIPPPGYGPPAYGPPGPPPRKKGVGAGTVVGLVVGAAVLAVALLVGTTLVLVNLSEEGSGGGLADGSTGEVSEYEGLSQSHVADGVTVDYAVFPPVGGDHYNRWQNCGVYTEPIMNETAVHSLEHGAVWVTYDPAAVDTTEAGLLGGLYSPGSYVIVSPIEAGMPAPVAASAWGVQLLLDAPDTIALEDFLQEHEQGPNTPEPGAPCAGGFGGTAADFRSSFEGTTV
ncbi:DUF3105 domain-containing protein [Nocardiopsis sp. LOL_012]|uniref:DUF3105 domain-containing protein n=1 Tax=Nocardiopsis sp. LOL_012 TaxID=3345409 RepID=UPI003A863F0A